MKSKDNFNKIFASYVVLLITIGISGQLCTAQNTNKNNYDVEFYHLNLNVSDSSTYISGVVTINVKVLLPDIENIVFDMSTLLNVDSVTVNNNSHSFLHNSDELYVHVNTITANTGDLLRIGIYYHGLGKNVPVHSGIYNKYSSSWDKNITWTLSEPFSALNWFPCKQSLSDKADSVYVFLSTDSDLKAGSNGILSAAVSLPDNRVRYEWKSKFPIAYYLISFSVSDYMDYSFYVNNIGGEDSLLVQNFIYDDIDYLQQNKANIDKTADLLLLYSDLFGPYPFNTEKYGHCVAPFSGGMEHQTMTTLVNFSFLLVAHELAHQWFGNFVTCKTWSDIWINEGFASYGEYLANQFLKSQADADRWIKNCNDFVKSLPGGSVFIPEVSVDNEGRIFDSRLSYKKGASIIHMIRQETGNDSLFFQTMASFLKKFGNSNASALDMKEHLKESTGIDFDQFFDQWYYGQGYPKHNIRYEHRNDTLYINSLQTVSSQTPFFNVLLQFKVSIDNRDTIFSFRQTTNLNNWQIYLPGNINNFEVDPNHWLLTEFEGVTTIFDVNSNDFTIRPNPANNQIEIQLKDSLDDYSIIIANAAGRIVKVQQSSLPREFIDVKAFPSGLYFIIIKNKETLQQSKFMIN